MQPAGRGTQMPGVAEPGPPHRPSGISHVSPGPQSRNLLLRNIPAGPMTPSCCQSSHGAPAPAPASMVAAPPSLSSTLKALAPASTSTMGSNNAVLPPAGVTGVPRVSPHPESARASMGAQPWNLTPESSERDRDEPAPRAPRNIIVAAILIMPARQATPMPPGGRRSSLQGRRVDRRGLAGGRGPTTATAARRNHDRRALGVDFRFIAPPLSVFREVRDRLALGQRWGPTTGWFARPGRARAP